MTPLLFHNTANPPLFSCWSVVSALLLAHVDSLSVRFRDDHPDSDPRVTKIIIRLKTMRPYPGRSCWAGRGGASASRHSQRAYMQSRAEPTAGGRCHASVQQSRIFTRKPRNSCRYRLKLLGRRRRPDSVAHGGAPGCPQAASGAHGRRMGESEVSESATQTIRPEFPAGRRPHGEVRPCSVLQRQTRPCPAPPCAATPSHLLREVLYLT